MTKKKEFDVLVFIGRFQPFHIAHQAIITKALELSHHVLVLVGSAKIARNQRNPFTWEERAQMIKKSFPDLDSRQLIISPIYDSKYNDNAWIRNVQSAVSGHLWDLPNRERIGLIGHSKDHTSYYLKMFPQWKKHVNVDKEYDLDATDIRNAFLTGGMAEVREKYIYTGGERLLPDSTVQFLQTFEKTDDYKRLHDEHLIVEKYKESWQNAPYAPTFVTVDAVLVQSGHILLVQRGASPGKGLWALPGGFINEYEKIEDAMIRELREETGLKVPSPVIRGSIVKSQVFDDPYRSDRGRTITHAYYIELRADINGLPKVKGGDDARHATWVPISSLEPDLLFEDHFEIVQNLLGQDLMQIRPSLKVYGKDEEIETN